MNERYAEMITSTLALASEAKIRSNERVPGETLQWGYLADQLYQAAVFASERVDMPDAELKALGDQADVTAVGVILAEQGMVPA